MTGTTEKRIVIFGAGKIGRSFIGQVFSRSGYSVIFIDINRNLISLLNQRKRYRVVIKSNEGDQVIEVTNVSGIHTDDRQMIIDLLSGTSIAAFSVGQYGLPAALPLVAESLIKRKQLYGDWPLDIIIAENMRNADKSIEEELSKLLPDGYNLSSHVGLIETSIGKMVPIMSKKDLEEDPLQVFAEPYNDLIVARSGFRNPIPDVSFLAPKENIKAWVDRKLFVHNLGHATAAYLGYQKNPGWRYLHEALADNDIYSLTRNTMLQSADVLRTVYPGEFTPEQLQAHIDDLLARFQNKALGDTIFRVGCDLYRKLSPDDRLVVPILSAIQHKLPFNLIFQALIAAVRFRAKDENGNFLEKDVEFFKEAEKGEDYILEHVCKIRIEPELKLRKDE